MDEKPHRPDTTPESLQRGLATVRLLPTEDLSLGEAIRIVHLSPKTLGLFARKLHEGFQILSSLGLPIESELFVDEDENVISFLDQLLPTIRNDDLILLEVHGCEQEKRLMDDVLRLSLQNKIIAVVHRPEELILRVKLEHQTSIDGAVGLLAQSFKRLSAVVLLGLSGVSQYEEIFPKAVYAIAHPYFAAQPLQLSHPSWRYQDNAVVVVGSNTTWGEMRSLHDVSLLLNSLRNRLRVIGYASGSFQSAHIDMPWYIRRSRLSIDDGGDILFLGNEEIEAALDAREITDEMTFREWLYRLSGKGQRMILRAVVSSDQMSFTGQSLPPASRASQWEAGLVDFNLQLYRESLSRLREVEGKDRHAPKQEYSGTLHKGIPEIFLVFDSPTLRDVTRTEGLRVISVPLVFSDPSVEDHAAKDRPSHALADQQPDFSEAIEQILSLCQHPYDRLEMLRWNSQVAASYGVAEAAYGYFLAAQTLAHEYPCI
jgi:hypothetical protein